jgi:hypothetical protein
VLLGLRQRCVPEDVAAPAAGAGASGDTSAVLPLLNVAGGLLTAFAALSAAAKGAVMGLPALLDSLGVPSLDSATLRLRASDVRPLSLARSPFFPLPAPVPLLHPPGSALPSPLSPLFLLHPPGPGPPSFPSLLHTPFFTFPALLPLPSLSWPPSPFFILPALLPVSTLPAPLPPSSPFLLRSPSSAHSPLPAPLFLFHSPCSAPLFSAPLSAPLFPPLLEGEGRPPSGLMEEEATIQTFRKRGEAITRLLEEGATMQTFRKGLEATGQTSPREAAIRLLEREGRPPQAGLPERPTGKGKPRTTRN